MKVYTKAKDVISDLFGLAVMVGTGMLIYEGKMSFLWEGVAGMAIGSLFFFVSDAGIAAQLKSLLQGSVKKFTKDDSEPKQDQ